MTWWLPACNIYGHLGPSALAVNIKLLRKKRNSAADGLTGGQRYRHGGDPKPRRMVCADLDIADSRQLTACLKRDWKKRLQLTTKQLLRNTHSKLSKPLWWVCYMLQLGQSIIKNELLKKPAKSKKKNPRNCSRIWYQMMNIYFTR